MNLIKLESVGTALNMETGMTHPINADGTIVETFTNDKKSKKKVTNL